jgi:hypothetical protein
VAGTGGAGGGGGAAEASHTDALARVEAAEAELAALVAALGSELSAVLAEPFERIGDALAAAARALLDRRVTQARPPTHDNEGSGSPLSRSVRTTWTWRPSTCRLLRSVRRR